MKLLLATAIVLAPMAADADCNERKPIQVTLAVTSCTAVDTSKVAAEYRSEYEGVLVSGRTDKKHEHTAWIPAAAKLDCRAIKPAAVIRATIEYACCDGDPNPPCYVGHSGIMKNVKIVRAK